MRLPRPLVALAFAVFGACTPSKTAEQAAPAPHASASATVAATVTGSAPSSPSPSPSPPAASAHDAGVDSCDAMAAQLEASGGLGLMAVGKGLDPVCRWKLEDANDRGLGYGAEHDRRGTQSVNGRIPPDRVKRALEKQEAAVSRCLEAKDGGANRAPVLRVRLEVSPSGEVGAVVTDYRAPIEAERAACVSATLKKVQLGKTDGGPAIIVYGFPAGK